MCSSSKLIASRFYQKNLENGIQIWQMAYKLVKWHIFGDFLLIAVDLFYC